MKVHHVLNEIRWEKTSTEGITVKAHPDRYEKEIDAVVAYLSQYVKKWQPTMSVEVSSIAQGWPNKIQKNSETFSTIRGRSELNNTQWKNTTQCWWHIICSYMSYGIRLDLLRAREPKTVIYYISEWPCLKQKQITAVMRVFCIQKA